VGDAAAPLQALIFDSQYDTYRGVVSSVRVMNGVMRPGERLQFMQAGAQHDAIEVGARTPAPKPVDELGPGEVGYLIAGIKDVGEARSGETVTTAAHPATKALEGYRDPKPMVFCGLFPIDGDDFENLRESLHKLKLNDASVTFEPESSGALGFGFRCGFLGMLHMEVIQQRLEREAEVDLIQTAPNVTYELLLQNDTIQRIDNPVDVPDSGQIKEFREPIAKVQYIVPSHCIGTLMQLCEDRRGIYKTTEYLGSDRAQLVYELPLAEIVYDMHDKLKSVTRGYGTMNYEVIGFREANLVKMDILVKGSKVEALAMIVHRTTAERRGRAVCKKLKEEISKHQFEIPIQAAIGTRIIARETIPALRKNVTAKCYGGDITRKRKLWAKQREGKKRLKQFGEVEIPQKAFLSVLDVSDDQ
jgi:GTP-binding protein LepA